MKRKQILHTLNLKYNQNRNKIPNLPTQYAPHNVYISIFNVYLSHW